MPEHTISHIEIPTNNPAGANEFYSHLFGWKIEVIPNSDYHMVYLPGDQTIALMKPELQGITGPLVYISTDDLEGTLARATEKGATVHTGPQAIPQGRWAVILDPTGTPMGLFQPTPR